MLTCNSSIYYLTVDWNMHWLHAKYHRMLQLLPLIYKSFLPTLFFAHKWILNISGFIPRTLTSAIKFIKNSQWGIVLQKERSKVSKTIEEKELPKWILHISDSYCIYILVVCYQIKWDILKNFPQSESDPN